jgi:uncharacterized protein (TIGR02271 family)
MMSEQSPLTGETEPSPPETEFDEAPVLTLAAEEMTVTRQKVIRARVRATKRVETRHEIVDEPLARETIEVERIPMGILIEGEPPSIREEGDVTIIPVIEETFVVVRRLLLREEVRLHRRRSVYHDPQEVVLRREVLDVERIPAEEQS